MWKESLQFQRSLRKKSCNVLQIIISWFLSFPFIIHFLIYSSLVSFATILAFVSYFLVKPLIVMTTICQGYQKSQGRPNIITIF